MIYQYQIMFQDGAERLFVLLNEKFCTEIVSTHHQDGQQRCAGRWLTGNRFITNGDYSAGAGTSSLYQLYIKREYEMDHEFFDSFFIVLQYLYILSDLARS